MMKTWRMLLWPGWKAKQPHGMARVYTNWCVKVRQAPNVKGDYDEDLKDAVVTWLNSHAATWYDDGTHKLVCQGTTSTLMLKATMMKTWRMLLWPGLIATQPHGMARVYTNWCVKVRQAPNVKGDYFEDLKDAVVTWLNSQAATWHGEGIHKLEPRYDKSFNVKGDYVE